MTSDLHDLWRERQEIGAALDSGLLAVDDPAWERFPDVDQAIREARPTDPAGLAVQMRLLADEFAAIRHIADETLALRIATALEKLGDADRHEAEQQHQFAQVASGNIAAPAQRPPLRLAIIGCAGAGSPRRLDRLPGNKKAPGARRPSVEQLVSKALSLVWTINIWLVTARAWWMGCRAAPAGRPAAAGAHSGSSASTASGPSFPRLQRSAVAADPEIQASVTCISWLPRQSQRRYHGSEQHEFAHRVAP
jgi:hypothetical protein